MLKKWSFLWSIQGEYYIIQGVDFFGGNGYAYNVRGGEYDNIYVNGGNNIQNMATEEDHFKVELIEEVFMNKMFEA